MSIYTDRYITVNWTNCERLPVVAGGDGAHPQVTYADNGQNRTIPLSQLKVGTTTYLYEDDESRKCLDSTTNPWWNRCTRTWMFQASLTPNSNEGAFVAACDITTSPVMNGSSIVVEQQVPDDIAQYISGAIGISGLGKYLFKLEGPEIE